MDDSETKPLGQVIGERVQQLREQRRWSQRELALRLGEVLQGPPAWDDHTTVNLIEKGKRRVLAAELLALAHVLDVDATALVIDPGGTAEVELGRGPIPIRMGDDPSATSEVSLGAARLQAAARSIVLLEMTARRVQAEAQRAARDSEQMADEMSHLVDAIDDLVEDYRSPKEGEPRD